MNIAFWNTHKNKEIDDYIIDLVIQNKCDIVILLEYDGDIEALINKLYVKELKFKKIPIVGCRKIKLIYKDNIQLQVNLADSSYVAINVKKNNFEFELFGVHFPSKIYTAPCNIQIMAKRLKNDIMQYNNAVVCGDFNMNPFEENMVAANSLYALPCKEKKYKSIFGNEYYSLYNPMWKFYDNFDKFPGTYYKRLSDAVDYYWNIFDQILISTSFVQNFNDASLKIIKKIDEKSLIKAEKIDVNISDHLPVFYEIKEE